MDSSGEARSEKEEDLSVKARQSRSDISLPPSLLPREPRESRASPAFLGVLFLFFGEANGEKGEQQIVDFPRLEGSNHQFTRLHQI